MQAYLRGLYGPNYLWIVLGWYDEQWWEEEGDFSCTPSQLYEVIEGSIAVQHYPIINDTDKKVVGDIVSCETIIGKLNWHYGNSAI